MALFVAVVVVVQDDGAEGDAVGERAIHIEKSLSQLHFDVELVLGVAAVGGHSGVDESSQT